METIEAWARRLAATLPPFTPEEAREVGRIAARIDERRRAQAAGQQTGQAAA